MDYLIQLDHQLFNFINQELSNSFFDWIMPLIRNKNTWIPFYLLTAVLLFKTYGKKSLFIVLAVVLSVGLADGISSHALKPFFERTRPCLLPGFMENVNLVVSRCSGAYSFPSSHAANHFAIAFLLILIIRKNYSKLSSILLFWAGIICFAQIYVGVHFPTDILGGLLIAWLAAVISYSIYRYSVDKINWQ